MKKLMFALVGLIAGGSVFADDVSDSDRMLCAISEVTVCFEGIDCIEVMPFEVGVPRFIIVDAKKKLLSTTEASWENRTTPIENLEREDGLLMLQGIEMGRAFSILIHESTGELTGTVSRDAAAVSAFGACTDANI